MILEKLLKQHFHYETFRNGQKEIISSVIEGNHTLAMLPTGTGKSLCYQLPAYLINGHVVIVSPLLSLMQDQVEQMKLRGEKRVVALNSFLSPQQKRKVLQNLHQYKFIFVSPEIIHIELIWNHLQRLKVGLFVVDEAHCISQWGYDFRPDYIRLGEIRKRLGSPLTLALTATATKEVREDIVRRLELTSWQEFVFSVDRPNISISAEQFEHHQEKVQRMIELSNQLEGPGIIYFSSKKMAEQMAVLLRQKKIGRAMAYHGGLDQETRILIQQQFIHGQLDIICATSAFGMGINKENIRFVIHFHLPMQLESFLQEIGRAGRDGERSVSILLYAAGDEKLALQLAEGEIPSEQQVDHFFSLVEEDPQLLKTIESQSENLQKLCGFTEVQWRIIEGSLRGVPKKEINMNKEKGRLKQFGRDRLSIKRSNIYKMVQWISLKSCKREFILNYFNEKMDRNVEHCCVHCGIDLSLFEKTKPSSIKENFELDWKKDLAELLLK